MTLPKARAWKSELLQRYPAPYVQGFPCYAPEVRDQDAPGGYDESSHSVLASLEADNWWFKSRNDLIIYAITQWFPGIQTYLEIGCGSGFVLSGILKALPGLHVVGSELFLSGLAETGERLPDVTLVQMDACDVPFREEFSLVGAFDVIEHIEDDLAALQNMYMALAPGGGLVLTVPQHEWMWSLADEQAHHVRRYTRRTLHTVVEEAGFKILWSRSFVSLLAPLMAMARLHSDEDARRRDPYIDFRINPRLNRALEAVSTAERRLIQRGVRFPIGGSRILVARKPCSPDHR